MKTTPFSKAYDSTVKSLHAYADSGHLYQGLHASSDCHRKEGDT